MKIRIFLIAGLLLAGSTTLAVAATQSERLAQRFSQADTNHDGKLTLQEAQAGMPMVAKHFSEIDTQGTGSITQAQIESFVAAHR
jgi:hypothetical protein